MLNATQMKEYTDLVRRVTQVMACTTCECIFYLCETMCNYGACRDGRGRCTRDHVDLDRESRLHVDVISCSTVVLECMIEAGIFENPDLVNKATVKDERTGQCSIYRHRVHLPETQQQQHA